MPSRVLALLLPLACAACAHEPLSAAPPVVPDAIPSSDAHPVSPRRSFETKTIGHDLSFGEGASSTATDAPRSSGSPQAPAARPDPWSPPPVYGHTNPNPPSTGTPLYGDLNPSPPAPGTPRYGDLNPSPPGPRTPRYGDTNPSPPGR